MRRVFRFTQMREPAEHVVACEKNEPQGRVTTANQIGWDFTSVDSVNTIAIERKRRENKVSRMRVSRPNKRMGSRGEYEEDQL